MTGVYRWTSTLGEEVLVLPVAKPYEFNTGNPNTTLVDCLVLYSEWAGLSSGDRFKFSVHNLKPFCSLQNRVR